MKNVGFISVRTLLAWTLALPRANTIGILYSPGFYLKISHEATLHLYRSSKVSDTYALLVYIPVSLFEIPIFQKLFSKPNTGEIPMFAREKSHFCWWIAPKIAWSLGPLVLGPAIHIHFQTAEPLFQDPAGTHIILENWFHGVVA